MKTAHNLSNIQSSQKPLQSFGLSNAVLLHKRYATVFVLFYMEKNVKGDS